MRITQYGFDLKDSRKPMRSVRRKVVRRGLPLPLTDEQVQWGLRNQTQWLFGLVEQKAS